MYNLTQVFVNFQELHPDFKVELFWQIFWPTWQKIDPMKKKKTQHPNCPIRIFTLKKITQEVMYG